MSTHWIDAVLRLNGRILAGQAVVNAQAFTIVDMMEAGEDTAKAEDLHRAYGDDLRLLRAVRDTMLDDMRDDV